MYDVFICRRVTWPESNLAGELPGRRFTWPRSYLSEDEDSRGRSILRHHQQDRQLTFDTPN
ncbi:hypothetical protein Hamer_G008362 [Homarus americanus]|uniref:Uncharacterized protein n=1 Tax=Homarus americanus TaxID=6706 RepID=A0A8J5NDJ3_HOMAM|nr:hypothetical protein Hamer_G008362 [Homarus americanus]